MAAYSRVDGLQSPAGWLPVHQDQITAQRSETSIGKLDLFLPLFKIVNGMETEW